MKSKKVKLLVTLKHPKGDIQKGSIYNWDENRNMYIHVDNKTGLPNASVNDAAVKEWSNMFEYVKEV